MDADGDGCSLVKSVTLSFNDERLGSFDVKADVRISGRVRLPDELINKAVKNGIDIQELVNVILIPLLVSTITQLVQ